MRCPHCRAEIGEALLQCASCGGDIGFTVSGLDRGLHGPHSLAALRHYVQVGRIGTDALVGWGGGQPRSVAEVLADAAPAESAVGPKRGKGPRCWCAAAVLGAVLVLAIAMPAVRRAHERTMTTTCISSLKELSAEMLMYACDHDQTLPPHDRWPDAIYPYHQNEASYNCPTTQLGRGSYELNPVLEGRSVTTVQHPAESPMLWDTGYPHGEGPHSDGWNLAFVDGHVKWAGQADVQRYKVDF